MKKLLALLMAALMTILPACAMAESYKTTLTITMDVDAMLPAMTEAFQQTLKDDTINAQALALACLEVLDGASFESINQENFSSFAIRLDDKVLLDMTGQIENGWTYVTSSLIPGKALTTFVGDEALSVGAQGANALSNQIIVTVKSWAQRIKPVVAQGSFIGDAYEGGKVCTTYTVDDADIATLVRGMLTDPLLSYLKDVLGEAGVGELRTLTEEMGTANAHEYVLRLVEDGAGKLVGVSFAAMKGESTLGTLSIGLDDTEAVAVMGLGLPEDNYWYQLNAAWAGSETAIQAFGQAKEWLGMRDETFAYVSAVNEPLTTFDWTMNHSADPMEMDLTLTSGGGRFVLTVAETEPLPVDLTGLSFVSMDDPGSEAYVACVEELGKRLLVRLVKLLPMDTIMTIPNLMELPE